MHLNSKLLFAKYGISYFKDNYKVLEIGPTGFPSVYSKQVNNDNIKWDTLDFANSTFIGNANKNLTFTIDSPYQFPVSDNTYDIVVSGQVIEHVQNLILWLKEIRRIVKKDGLVIIINPVSWPFHEAPLDCWRIYPSGMEVLADLTGLSIVKSLFDSLEIQDLLMMDSKVKYIPGRSYNHVYTKRELKLILLWNKLIRNIPYISKLAQPIEVSFDTITIFRKV